MKIRWIGTLAMAVLVISQTGCGKKITVEDYFAQADTLRVKGKLSEAVNKLAEIPETFPLDTVNVIKSLTLKADIYGADLRDFTKAVECHQKVIENYPEHYLTAKSYIIIAVTYENELKDLEKARQYYEGFLKKYPTHELASGVKGALDLLGISDEELEKRILQQNQKVAKEME